eukprot:167555-Amphidinium_carterae.1
MGSRLGLVPSVGGWRAQDQWFPWDEARLRTPPPAEVHLRAPREVGPHKRVVEYDEFVRCLDCCRRPGKIKG